jgi:hypothetical protein
LADTPEARAASPILNDAAAGSTFGAIVSPLTCWQHTPSHHGKLKWMLDLPPQVFMLGSVHENNCIPSVRVFPRPGMHSRDCRARAMVQMA